MEVELEQELRKNKLRLLRSSFFNLLSVEVLGVLVNSLNAFIDTAIVAKFLNTESMAAIGFFQPMLTIISLVWVIIIGLQILCSRYMGAGDKESLEALFATAVVFLGGISIVASIALHTQCAALAGLLGAEGVSADLLQDYIKGYSFGIIGQVYCAMLMWFLAFNYDIKLSRIVVGFMIISNLALNLIFVAMFNLGVFGLGLASALSYLLSAAMMLQSFFHKNKPIQLKFHKFLFGRLLKSARVGFPALTFNLGVTAKSFILNVTLMTYIGVAGVAAMNVQGNIIGILGSVPVGFGNTFMALGSLYYGSKDRFLLLYLAKMSLKLVVVVAGGMVVLLTASAYVTPQLFFNPAEQAYDVTVRMLLLFPSFLVFNAIPGILLKSYQFQEKNEALVNVVPIIENLLIATLAVATAPVFGIDAVWLSFPVAEVFCIMLIGLTVFDHRERTTFKLDEWLQLNKDFGVAAEDCFEHTFKTIEDATKISRQTIDFCKAHDFDNQRSTFAGLAIEEMVTNIVQYGFEPGKDYNAYVRVTLDDEICIRIHDNASGFNLKEKLLNSVGDYPEEDNISLRIVEKILEKIDYQNNAGVNTVVLVV